MKIYVASSWRNQRLTDVVAAIRAAGHEVYDFRENEAFDWVQIDPQWEKWTPEQFRDALKNPLATAGHFRDVTALNEADMVVLVAPCGRSSHLELGMAIGQGKRVAVLLEAGERPELTYRSVDFLCLDMPELLGAIEVVELNA